MNLKLISKFMLAKCIETAEYIVDRLMRSVPLGIWVNCSLRVCLLDVISLLQNMTCLIKQFMFPISLFFVGDEEQSGPSWAAEDDDDPENRYGSKRSDVKFVKHPKCGRKAAPSNPNYRAKSNNTPVIKTQVQPIQTRPKRSCSRAPAIKYTF